MNDKLVHAAFEAYPLDSNASHDEILADEHKRQGFIQGYLTALGMAEKWIRFNWRNHVYLDADNVIHFGGWQDEMHKDLLDYTYKRDISRQ